MISGCLSHEPKTESQTDQSLATPGDTYFGIEQCLIGRFDFQFYVCSWNKQPDSRTARIGEVSTTTAAADFK